MSDSLTFLVTPYVCLALLVGVSAWRVLSGRVHPNGAQEASNGTRPYAWGAVSLALGLAGLLLGHLIGLLAPERILAWNRVPWRLWLLEGAGLACASLALFGMLLMGVTRLRQGGPGRLIASAAWTVLAVVLASGLAVALAHRWGSSWYAAVLVPYLRSLLTLDPRLGLVSTLPFAARLHAFSSFILLALVPAAGWLDPLLRPLARRRPGDRSTASTAVPADAR